VPVAAFGPHTVFGVGQTSGFSASSSFMVRPAINLVPATGRPGTAFTLSGTGFGAGEVVTASWNCSANPCSGGMTLGSTIADGTGSISSLILAVPLAATVGPHAVGAHGISTSGFAHATFRVKQH
jgi:hypothetical protein